MDTHQLIPALALLAQFEGELAERILKKTPLLPLGSVFSPHGRVRLRLDLGLGQPLTLELEEGELVCLPLGKGRRTEVEFESDRNKGSFEAHGGEVGLVIDTRLRPLALPSTRHERFKILKEWKDILCAPKLP